MVAPVFERRRTPSLGLLISTGLLKEYSGSFTIELLYEHGLFEMLEASDYESVDQDSPFIDVIMNRMCGV